MEGITRRGMLAGMAAAFGAAILPVAGFSEEAAQPEEQAVEEAPQENWVQVGGYAFAYPSWWESKTSESGTQTFTAGSVSTIIATTVDMKPPTSAVVAEQLVELLSGAYYQGNTESGKRAVVWLDYAEGCTKGLEMGGLTLKDGRYMSIMNFVIAQEGYGVLLVTAMTDNAEFWAVMNTMNRIIQTTAPTA